MKGTCRARYTLGACTSHSFTCTVLACLADLYSALAAAAWIACFVRASLIDRPWLTKPPSPPPLHRAELKAGLNATEMVMGQGLGSLSLTFWNWVPILNTKMPMRNWQIQWSVPFWREISPAPHLPVAVFHWCHSYMLSGLLGTPEMQDSQLSSLRSQRDTNPSRLLGSGISNDASDGDSAAEAEHPIAAN